MAAHLTRRSTQALHRTTHSASFILKAVPSPHHETLHGYFSIHISACCHHIWIVPELRSAFLSHFPPHLLFILALLPCPGPPRWALQPLCHHPRPLFLSHHSYYSLHDLLTLLSVFPLNFPLWNISFPKGSVWWGSSTCRAHSRCTAFKEQRIGTKGCAMDD